MENNTANRTLTLVKLANADEMITAGPWHVETSRTQYPDLFEYRVLAPNPDAGQQGVSYAGESLSVAGPLDSKADACLIAAAPDLLAALKAHFNGTCYCEFPRGGFTHHGRHCELTVAAIAKAERGA